MLGGWQVQKGQKINTWARHIQTAEEQKQNLESTANIPQLQERGIRGTWDVSSETTPAREESDSMCVCVCVQSSHRAHGFCGRVQKGCVGDDFFLHDV